MKLLACFPKFKKSTIYLLNTIVCGVIDFIIVTLLSMNIDIAIANVLRSIREKNKISQEQLAFKAQLHRTYISQIERGLKSVTVKTLFKLTEALDVEIDFFLKKVKDELTGIQS